MAITNINVNNYSYLNYIIIIRLMDKFIISSDNLLFIILLLYHSSKNFFTKIYHKKYIHLGTLHFNIVCQQNTKFMLAEQTTSNINSSVSVQ